MKIERVRQFALSLPDASEAPHFESASFRVGGKLFATVPPDQAHVHVFVGEDQREPALALHSAFIEKLHWGSKVVGLRITLAKAQPAVVEALLRHAWAAKAPKRLLDQARK
jgi:hypothetical protein